MKSRNREELDREDREFIEDVAEDLDLSSEAIAVYPLTNNAGLYNGRFNGETIIGTSVENDYFRYVMAHELGHDRKRQELGEGFQNDVAPKTNAEGELVVEGARKRNDRIEMIIDEIFAENVARGYFDEVAFSRSPLSKVDLHLDAFQDQISVPNQGPTTVLKTKPEEGESGRYFAPPRSYQDFQLINTELRARWEPEQDKTEELAELIYNTWENRVHKSVIRGEDDVFWDNVEPFLDMEFEGIWHQIPDNYGERVRETIEDELHRIVYGIKTDLRTEIAGVGTGIKVIPETILDNFSTSNPSHFSALIQSGRLSDLETDYNHQIGNFVGSTLYELGVRHTDLESNPEALRELAGRSIELGVEMGKYDEDFYNQSDYKEAIELLAIDVDLI